MFVPSLGDVGTHVRHASDMLLIFAVISDVAAFEPVTHTAKKFLLYRILAWYVLQTSHYSVSTSDLLAVSTSYRSHNRV